MRHTKALIAPTDDRKARFTASTATIDSDGDTINQAGWELDDFRKNPVVLFAHDRRSLPVGRVTEISSGSELTAEVEFLRQGVDEFADKVAVLVKEGFLNAVSVGFQPIEYDLKFDEMGFVEGYEFKRQSLKELSIVPVPANAEALAITRELNLSAEQKSMLFVSEKSSCSTLRNRTRIARVRALHKFY